LSERTGPRDPAAKVHDWEGARRWREQCAGRVVFTNGVFDLLHPGHVTSCSARGAPAISSSSR
jgi:ADP-heptose synthase, bifunctional sugar kinase/adenylyltransferase